MLTRTAKSIFEDIHNGAPATGQHVAAVCVPLALALFAVDIFGPPGLAESDLYVIAVLLSIWSPSRRLTMATAALCTALTAVGYLIVPTVGEPWVSLSNRILAVVAIWATAALAIHRKGLIQRREQDLCEREEALRQIKVLRGLLPICASCKRIRDDKGYWTQIESYLCEHSEAELTHGLCPDCMVHLYPELYRPAPED